MFNKIFKKLFKIIKKGEMMTESYKLKSKIATAISFLAALIAYLGKDGLTQIMPTEYANLIPIIVFIAGYILSQSTENKRVDIAEQIMLEKFAKVLPTEDVDPTAEYEKLYEKYDTAVGDEYDH